MPRTVDIIDAARMTAPTSRETTSRVSEYFSDAGPFSYGSVRKLTPVLLEGSMPLVVALGGLEKIKFDLARKCNIDVARLVSACVRFRGCTFYRLQKILYPIDRDFALGLRPETVAVVNGVPNLIFLQPRKNPTPWAYSPSFMRRVLEEVYIEYFEEFKLWIVDTEAVDGSVRGLNLVDLQAVPPMADREFTRRIASLRQAWRLHLTKPKQKRDKVHQIDDRQDGFGF